MKEAEGGIKKCIQGRTQALAERAKTEEGGMYAPREHEKRYLTLFTKRKLTAI